MKLQVMKDRLAEVAHQSLPPSGIPIPIPPLVQKKNQYWTELNDDNTCQELSLNEYDDTFLFLWYQSIGNSLSVNLSRYDIGEELLNLRNENNKF